MEIEKEMLEIKVKLAAIERHLVNLNVTIQQSKLIEKPDWVEKSEYLHSQPIKIDQREFKETVDSFNILLDQLKKGINLIDPQKIYSRQDKLTYQFNEMKESIHLLVKYINKGKRISVNIDGFLIKDDEEIKLDECDMFGFLKMSVDDSELSIRTSNCLRALDLKTWADVYKYSASKLLETKTFGKKSLNEVKNHFQQHGIVFK